VLSSSRFISFGTTMQWGHADDKKLFKGGNCSDHIRGWLFDHGSLTTKLEAINSTFRVEVQNQETVSQDINLSGYFNDEKQVYIREVLLYSNNIPVVFAQTEIPCSTLTYNKALLNKVGNHSLGKILFRDPSMVRGQIEACQFVPSSEIHLFCKKLGQATDKPLWARRSLFYLHKKPLLVTELLLPAMDIY
jgi:chorismate--pyruvate lyase